MFIYVCTCVCCVCVLNFVFPPMQTVATTWTDLMLWATLIGKTELARSMWTKTKQPMRSALMAAQLCTSLSKKP